MNGWCPRCDALRGRAAVCPVCHTPLAGLEPERPAAPALPAGAAPAGAAAGPPRIRVALAVAAVVVAGIAFVAGRAGGAGVRPRGGPAATVPATTAGAQPADQRRTLGWSSASRGGVRVTAVAIDRGQEPGEDADAGRLHLRVAGLEPGERVLAFKDLRLRDTGRGLFASPDRSVVGETSGAEALPEAPHGGAVPAQDDQRTYAVSLGPTPPPSQLATVQVGGLVVGRTDGATIGLDTPTPWPDQGPGRAAGLGTDAVTVSPWPREAGIAPLRLEVTAAFVGAGRATAVIGVKPTTLEGQAVTGIVPVSAELRAGDRVLCQQTEMVSGAIALPGPGLVVSCPAPPTDRLTVRLGAGAKVVPLNATLPAGTATTRG